MEYLALCIDTVCGTGSRGRAGSTCSVPSPRPKSPGLRQLIPRPPTASANRPAPGSRPHPRGMPSSTLAEEILLDGPGRSGRCSAARHPVASFPDQSQTIDAMRHLDLLVQIDPSSHRRPSRRLRDRARMTPEMAGHTQKIESASTHYATGYGFPPTMRSTAIHRRATGRLGGRRGLGGLLRPGTSGSACLWWSRRIAARRCRLTCRPHPHRMNW